MNNSVFTYLKGFLFFFFAFPWKYKFWRENLQIIYLFTLPVWNQRGWSTLCFCRRAETCIPQLLALRYHDPRLSEHLQEMPSYGRKQLFKKNPPHIISKNVCTFYLWKSQMIMTAYNACIIAFESTFTGRKNMVTGCI